MSNITKTGLAHATASTYITPQYNRWTSQARVMTRMTTAMFSKISTILDSKNISQSPKQSYGLFIAICDLIPRVALTVLNSYDVLKIIKRRHIKNANIFYSTCRFSSPSPS